MRSFFVFAVLFFLFCTSSAQSNRQPPDADSLPPAKELKEVIITGKKTLFRQTPEGLIVNTESSIMSKGSTALEVLERSPGVMIDRRNNNIVLNGKAGVLVLLNGKPMRMPMEQAIELLSTMSANDITKIELLDSPPAGYDAEGAAGIINIVTKKTKKKGTSGSLALTTGYGKGEKVMGGFNLAHNGQWLSVYGNYSFSRDGSYSDMLVTSSQDMPAFGGKLSVIVNDTTRVVRTSHNAVMGVDARLGGRTVSGYNITLNNSLASSGNRTHSDFTLFPDSLLFFGGYVSNRNRWNNLLHSFYAEHTIRGNEKVSIDLGHLRFNNQNPSVIENLFLNKYGNVVGGDSSLFSSQQRGSAGTRILINVAKIDYERPIGDKIKIEAGVKATYTRTASQSHIKSLVNGTWTSRNETVNNVEMKEKIGAIYASASMKSDSSTSLVAGFRYEYTATKFRDPAMHSFLVDRIQKLFFPAISFSRKLNNRSEFQASLSSRVSRPSYNDLASFVRYSDPTAVYTGNTLLKPTISHNLKVGYVKGNYNVALTLGHDKHPIVRYQISESEERNLLLILPQNLKYENNLMLQTGLSLRVNDWWSMNASISGGMKQYKLEHTKQPLRKTYVAYSGNFTQSFKLPANFSGEISGFYNSRTYNGTIDVGGMGAINMGLKKEMNNRGSFQLTVTDVLTSMRINNQYGTLTQEAFSVKNHVYINLESSKFPVFRVTYTQLIGIGNRKSERTPKTGVQDARERVE